MIFYGETTTGRRIHIGNWLSPRHTSRETWVYTFCGSEMSTWEEGERPPLSRAEDFCRNCFRAYAWQTFLNTAASAPATVPVPALVYSKVVAPSVEKLASLLSADNDGQPADSIEESLVGSA